jgi:hypothetical protein
VPIASHSATNSGTVTCRCSLSIMPMTECGGVSERRDPAGETFAFSCVGQDVGHCGKYGADGCKGSNVELSHGRLLVRTERGSVLTERF